MSIAYGERLKYLNSTRHALYALPCDELVELPGRPNVLYCLKDYTKDKVQGAIDCRSEVQFLFKAFETGQKGPRRLARLADRPRNTTIHEYLDWTVTAAEAKDDGDYDFTGFRVLVLYPRERMQWPAPGQFDKEGPKTSAPLGAPKPPLPRLSIKAKALSAATIRAGPDYLEVPFVATHEMKRGRGYGRCVLEAIEDVARALGMQRILLCSTNEESIRNTWLHLGFSIASEQDMHSWDVKDSDLVHMQNTVQMAKAVPPAKHWRSLVIRHQAFAARVYAQMDYLPSSSGRTHAYGMLGRGANGTMSGVPSISGLTADSNGRGDRDGSKRASAVSGETSGSVPVDGRQSGANGNDTDHADGAQRQGAQQQGGDVHMQQAAAGQAPPHPQQAPPAQQTAGVVQPAVHQQLRPPEGPTMICALQQQPAPEHANDKQPWQQQQQQQLPPGMAHAIVASPL